MNPNVPTITVEDRGNGRYVLRATRTADGEVTTTRDLAMDHTEINTEYSAEQVAAYARGLLADAFSAGQAESVGDVAHDDTLIGQLRAAEAARTEERDALAESLDQANAREQQLEARITHQVERANGYQGDFNLMAQMLLDEANSRDWCSEYDDFVDRVNSRTTYLDLIHRAKEYTADISVPIKFTVSSSDDEHDIATNIARAMAYYMAHNNMGDWAFEVNGEGTSENVDEA